MRLRAYYNTLSLAVIRRVVAPFTVLNNRGTTAHYSQWVDLDHLEPGGYDLVVLADIRLAPGEQLPRAQGAYVYDLSDTALLDDEAVLRTMAQCRAVLVTTPAAAVATRAFHTHVVMSPSMVHRDWLFSVKVLPPEQPSTLLLATATEDVLPILPALLRYLKMVPQQQLLTVLPDVVQRLPVGRAQLILPEAQHYPVVLRSCPIVLAPGHEPTRDPVGLYEAALCGGALLVGPGYRQAGIGQVCQTLEQWQTGLDLLRSAEIRSAYVRRQAHEAGQMTAFVQTDEYLKRLRRLARQLKVA